MSNLYDKITTLCELKGISRSTLCLETGIPSSFFSELKKGKTKSCRADKAAKIADYFGITVTSLFSDDNIEMSEQPTAQRVTEPEEKEKASVRIPVYGRIAAGIPMEAIEEILDYEEIPAAMAKDGEYIALQIKGDSMEPQLKTGDVVIIRKQTTIDSGQLAAVLINGNEATVKKVILRRSGITLVPFNTKYEPQNYTATQVEELPVTIIGRVVEARCKF